MRDDEIRDEGEGASFSLETGELTPRWSPSRCGFYQGEQVSTNAPGLAMEILREAGQTVTRIGEDVMCAEHVAEFLGVSEDRIQRLGLVRSDHFNVWSVEELAAKGLRFTRDVEACKRTYYGNCLWPMGEVVIWVGSAVELEALLAGGPIEGSMNPIPEPRLWTP